MNSFNFEKCMKQQVIPNLPLGSVLIIENTSYQGELEDKVPNKSHTKKLCDLQNTGIFLTREIPGKQN